MSDNLTSVAVDAQPFPPQPIERRKVYELVADGLTARIGAGGLLPGDTLPPERELTAAFGVGRSSVREALRMLESRGLIQSRGKGTFTVSPLTNPLNHSLGFLLAADATDLRELFEVRRLLEGELAALAATRRRRAHLARMREALGQMEAGLDSEDRYIAADLRFHLTIAEASGNRIASHLMHAIRDQVQRALGTVYHIPGSPRASLEQHREILGAIDGRDAAGARARMHDHIGRVEHEVRGITAADGRRR